jgi:hypothetical protein
MVQGQIKGKQSALYFSHDDQIEKINIYLQINWLML